MSTMSIAKPGVLTTESFWARISLRLKDWGRKIKTVAQRVGDFFVRGAKWLYHTPVIQWITTKTVAAASWVWYYAKGPVLWVAAPIAAMIFAPKTVAIMLALVLVALVIIGFFAYRSYKHLRTISTADELQELVDQVTEAVASDVVDFHLSFLDPPITMDETDETRINWVDEQMLLAQEASDPVRFSELTGRAYLINTRVAGMGKLSKTASSQVIYRACRKEAERANGSFPWDWTAMYNAVRAEDKRRNDRIRMHREGSLTSV